MLHLIPSLNNADDEEGDDVAAAAAAGAAVGGGESGSRVGAEDAKTDSGGGGERRADICLAVHYAPSVFFCSGVRINLLRYSKGRKRKIMLAFWKI